MQLPKNLITAVEAARAHEYEPHLEFHLAAVIVTGGSVVSIGYNSSKANSFIRAFAVTDYAQMHAECHAVLKARKKIDLRGAKMYVARVTKVNGIVGNSRPCEMCQNAARLYGIKKIYYTIDERTYAVMRV